jgi:lactate dehydrogenase-like 2-hydroxyacid dehydrogenase
MKPVHSIAKKPVVVVVESLYRKARAVFDAAADLQIEVAPALEQPLADLVGRHEPCAVVLGVDRYQGPLYAKMPRGGLIARFGVGTDGIDFSLAARHGLKVTNTPGVLEATVAEATVFLAAEMIRGFGALNRSVKEGTWRPTLGLDLQGKCWAIMGLGQIGRELSKILSFGFGVRVIGFKRHRTNTDQLKEEYGVQEIFTDYSQIAPLADVVSVHLPAMESTRHFFNRQRLAQLKPGVLFVNTGRGSLVDECALYEALLSGHIAAAGLDVFEKEPYEPVDPAKDLRTLAQVIMTPHISSSTRECVERMARRVLHNIRLSLQGNEEAMDLVEGVGKPAPAP